MEETIIELKNISKKYSFYSKPSDRLKELFTGKSNNEGIWALKNISFSILKGEAIGIVGENGAGKSTLLSIISGITKPTTGYIKCNGKVASLLELGIGFHPEFTGIENIYLYGSMIGLNRKEIDKNLDKIIEFSELGNAVQRPIKTFSTGMIMRLAFSVSINIKPDILILDEALSVGDIHFQKKSFDEILKFKENGGTLLFCSHSIYHVIHLCEKAIWLKEGNIMKFDEANSVIAEYENYMREKDKSLENNLLNRQVNNTTKISIKKANIEKNNQNITAINTGDTITLKITIQSIEPIYIHIAVGLNRNDGLTLYATSTEISGLEPILVNDLKEISFTINNLNLLAGEYHFVVLLMDDKAINIYSRYITENFVVKRKTKEFGIFKIKYIWNI